MGKYIEYDGVKFFLNAGSGYYSHGFKNHGVTTNVSLHRYVWEKFNGTIPEGYEVHHIDGNRANNDITNLSCSRMQEHRRGHFIERMGVKFDGKCLVCGCAIPKDKSGVFCSKRCKQAYARKEKRYMVERVCSVCGKTFLTNKYREGKTCSPSCRAIQFERDMANEEKESVCVICGKRFHKRGQKKLDVCSPKCAGKLWDLNNPEKVAEHRRRCLKGKTYRTKFCVICGKPFTTWTNARKCCGSEECVSKLQHDAIYRFDKVCPVCGKEFKAERLDRRCCSKSCANKYRFMKPVKTP